MPKSPSKPAAKKVTAAKTPAAATSASAGTAAAIASASAQIAAALKTLAPVGLTTLTSAQRKESNGKLRDGEAGALLNVLDVVDAFPGLFASLADKDGGVDDSVVETGPARDDLALWSALAPLAAQVEAFHTAINDTMLAVAEAAKDVSLPAYGIVRANLSSNAKLAKLAAPAVAFYGLPAKQRAANKAKAARKAKTPAS